MLNLSHVKNLECKSITAYNASPTKKKKTNACKHARFMTVCKKVSYLHVNAVNSLKKNKSFSSFAWKQSLFMHVNGVEIKRNRVLHLMKLFVKKQ